MSARTWESSAMKTARERAQQAIAAVRGNHGKDTLAVVEHVIREAMWDQRRACAEAVNAVVTVHDAWSGTAKQQAEEVASYTVHDAHAACMNAPFPGEDT